MTESYVKQGDCLDLISEVPSDSVDLLLTDCPYKLISGGCVSWTCDFVSHEDARKMIEKGQKKGEN